MGQKILQLLWEGVHTRGLDSLGMHLETSAPEEQTCPWNGPRLAPTSAALCFSSLVLRGMDHSGLTPAHSLSDFLGKGRES